MRSGIGEEVEAAEAAEAAEEFVEERVEVEGVQVDEASNIVTTKLETPTCCELSSHENGSARESAFGTRTATRPSSVRGVAWPTPARGGGWGVRVAGGPRRRGCLDG